MFHFFDKVLDVELLTIKSTCSLQTKTRIKPFNEKKIYRKIVI